MAITALTFIAMSVIWVLNLLSIFWAFGGIIFEDGHPPLYTDLRFFVRTLLLAIRYGGQALFYIDFVRILRG